MTRRSHRFPTALLPSMPGLQLDHTELTDHTLTVHLCTVAATAPCPAVSSRHPQSTAATRAPLPICRAVGLPCSSCYTSRNSFAAACTVRSASSRDAYQMLWLREGVPRRAWSRCCACWPLPWAVKLGPASRVGARVAHHVQLATCQHRRSVYSYVLMEPFAHWTMISAIYRYIQIFFRIT
jgi:hypothetical protein